MVIKYPPLLIRFRFELSLTPCILYPKFNFNDAAVVLSRMILDDEVVTAATVVAADEEEEEPDRLSPAEAACLLQLYRREVCVCDSNVHRQ